MSDFIVFGGINMDLFAYVPRSTQEGETIEASSVEFYLGGKGANQAVALSRLGAEVSFVGTLGEDQFGKELEALVSAEKIDLKNLRKQDGQSGVALINVLKDGRNEVISFPGVNKKTSSKYVSEKDLKSCSILIGQMELEDSQTNDLFIRAKKNNCLTLLNLAPFRMPSSSLIKNTDVLIVNETEFAGLLNKKSNKLDLDFVLKNISSLNFLSKTKLIVTLGSLGVVTFSEGETKYFESRKVDAIDTVGAGDCFLGALGFSLKKDSDIFKATEFANCAASISVTRKGAAESMPSFDEVVKIL